MSKTNSQNYFRRRYCDSCKKTYYFDKTMPDHDCNSFIRYCSFCKRRHDSRVLCELKIPSRLETNARLAFVAIALQDNNGAKCSACASFKTMCKGHRSTDLQFISTNALCIASEVKRGEFSIQFFGEKGLKLECDSEPYKQLYDWPHEMKPRTRKYYGLTSVLNYDCTHYLESFFQHVCTAAEFENTILVGQTMFLHLSLIHLLRMDIKVKSVIKGLDIMVIKIPLNQITLLNIEAYVDKKFAPKMTSPFCWNLNFEDFYNIRTIPSTKYFTSPYFTEEENGMIKDYVENFDGEWNFTLELQKSLKNHALQLLDYGLSINNAGMMIQKYLLEKTNANVNLESPLDFNSWASFSYSNLLHFSLSKATINCCLWPEMGVPTYSCSKIEFIFQQLQVCSVSTN